MCALCMSHIAFFAVHLFIRDTLEREGWKNFMFLGKTLSIFFQKDHICKRKRGEGGRKKRGDGRKGLGCQFFFKNITFVRGEEKRKKNEGKNGR